MTTAAGVRGTRPRRRTPGRGRRRRTRRGRCRFRTSRCSRPARGCGRPRPSRSLLRPTPGAPVASHGRRRRRGRSPAPGSRSVDRQERLRRAVDLGFDARFRVRHKAVSGAAIPVRPARIAAQTPDVLQRSLRITEGHGSVFRPNAPPCSATVRIPTSWEGTQRRGGRPPARSQERVAIGEATARACRPRHRRTHREGGIPNA